MDTVKWGIIGCGDVCEVKSGPAFYTIEGSSLVAVMRRDAAKAEDFAQRHQVKKWYTDAEDLINDPEVDIVYVATPPNTHKEYAIKAMKAGKPVYVEKPMALNYEECLEMIRVSKETGQKLFPAFYRRALPYFLTIKDSLDKGVIGEVLTVEVKHFRAPDPSDLQAETQTWRLNKEIAGEGYFFDLAPHTLDILDFLLGEPDGVKSFATNRRKLYEAKDTLSAILHFKTGITATIHYCFVVSKESEDEFVRITGTKGSLLFSIFSFIPIQLKTDGGDTELFDFPRPLHIQQSLIQTIVDELGGAGTCPSTAESGARASYLLDRIVEQNQ